MDRRSRQARALRVALKTAAFAAGLFAGAVAAESTPDEQRSPVIAAILSGKPIIDVRYRFETNDTDGFDRRAIANTIRTRFGYETGVVAGIRALVEFENVAVLGDDRFNSMVNGRTQFPIVADPAATEINRAEVVFSGIDGAEIRFGRQRFNLLNQRFLGAVDFRQNQQTFDAARLFVTPVKGLSFDYLHIRRVHRVFGDDHPFGEFEGDSHVFAASYDAGRLGVVSAYGLLLDLENSPVNSSATWGGRYANKIEIDETAGAHFSFVAEYASQRDHARNPFNYRESYLHGEATFALRSVAAIVGYESLGGNGAIGFSTPLATLHKFQGLADAFLVTPAQGIEDVYATLSLRLPAPTFLHKANLFVTAHDFESESGELDFGRELDAGLMIAITKHWSAELSGAVFDGGDFGPADRSIVWTSLRFQY
ncbi:alginate export family protein [Amphiplicatus metriothermophilus]|uniref:Alginate export n=1 Tax=Amphiplicatus metriothermophilus TaxID=1519374 RepID=A0A239PQ05_9PROT|nr:alginate export family protein [Amphiplicatus metriothermophilus]MBB5518470.1 hypothetical protein [Amphiplicatus metriothermophilus]SNT72369.1 Alginate export [Amphiplicatus metriothermophilus]